MKDPATRRYFWFLQRLFLFFLPLFGLVVLLAWALDQSLDWSRLAGIAALMAAVAASLSSYRTTKKEMRKDKDQE